MIHRVRRSPACVVGKCQNCPSLKLVIRMSMAQETLQLDAIAHRLTLVEKGVSQLRRMLPRQPTADSEPWYLEHAGRFADDPEFQEMIRLGREIRRADRSKES